MQGDTDVKTTQQTTEHAWTQSQRQALQCLGIDPEIFLDWPSASPQTLATQPPEDAEAEAVLPSLYKLGPWALQFPDSLPVERFTWLNDLARFIGSKPIAISHGSDQLTWVDCTAYAQNQLTPEQKKALWAQLKPALNARSE